MATSAGAWGLIVLGGLMVLSGGVVATLGWNKHSDIRHRENLISSLKQEWKLNDQLICDALKTAKNWISEKDAKGFSKQPYKSDRLIDLIFSNVHDDSDKGLRNAAETYEREISDFNANLNNVGKHNPALYIKKDLILNPPEKMPLNEDDLLSPSFRDLRDKHIKMGIQLDLRTDCQR